MVKAPPLRSKPPGQRLKTHRPLLTAWRALQPIECCDRAQPPRAPAHCLPQAALALLS